MTEILLHVGMDKTGSSSIQQAFADYDDGTLAYAQLGSANHSMPIQMMFRDPGDPTRALRAQGLDRAEILRRRERSRADLAAALDGARARVLISAEGVLSLKPSQLRALQAVLAGHGRSIRPLAYVRDPAGYAASAFQQDLKAGRHVFRVPGPRYATRLDPLERIFGAENVTLLPFRPSRFPGGSVVRDFATRIGADLSRIQDRRTNESFTLPMAAALFRFNRERPELTGSPRLFRARLRLGRTLLREEARRQARIRKRMAARPDLSPQLERGLHRPRFRFAASLVNEHLAPRDLRWLERRADLAMVPSAGSESDADGITSEEQLLDISATAATDLAPIAERLGVTPADTSTPALMDAIFDELLRRAG